MLSLMPRNPTIGLRLQTPPSLPIHGYNTFESVTPPLTFLLYFLIWLNCKFSNILFVLNNSLTRPQCDIKRRRSVCTVNSFFSRRTKSEKRKTAVFRFPYAIRKSTHGFPYRFSHFCRTRKTKNELYIAFLPAR